MKQKHIVSEQKQIEKFKHENGDYIVDGDLYVETQPSNPLIVKGNLLVEGDMINKRGVHVTKCLYVRGNITSNAFVEAIELIRCGGDIISGGFVKSKRIDVDGEIKADRGIKYIP